MRKKKENKREMNENLDVRGVEWYRGKIIDIIKKIDNKQLLKRIYGLAEYLYIYK